MRTILLVDDNDDDLFAVQRALTRAGVNDRVQIATNGQEAIDYLSGAGKYADRTAYPNPAMVFLDLKMPLRDGFDVLQWARTRKELERVPIIVLSGSDELRDHQRAYSLGARSYLVKPPTPNDLRALMQSLQSLLGVSV